MIATAHDQKPLSGKSHAVLAACLSSFVMIIVLLLPTLTSALVKENQTLDNDIFGQAQSDPSNVHDSTATDELLVELFRG